MGKGFDEYAPAYDAWFLENRNVLYSEINLVAHVLKNPGRTLSVGCGSGLFETILAKEYGITITDGIEPSEGMAEIARKRGMKVTISTAEEADFGCGDYDTILFNGTPQLHHRSGKRRPQSLRRPARRRPDHPDRRSEREHLRCAVQPGQSPRHVGSSAARGDLSRESLSDRIRPGRQLAHDGREDRAARKSRIPGSPLRPDPHTHPLYSNRQEEQPSEGYEKGDYVAVTACK